MAKQIIPFKVDDETTLFAEVEVIPPLEGMEVTPKRLTEVGSGAGCPVLQYGEG